MKLSGIRLPLAVKVFLACTVLALVGSLAGGIILYRGASHSLVCEVREHLKTVAATAALQVDPELHRQIRTRADESSDAYRRLKAVLARIRDANPGIRYVYTMRKTSKKNVWQFTVDAEEDPKNVSHVGDDYDISNYPEMPKAYLGPAADEEPAQDKWGTWLSGYAPIRDRAGRVEAIIGLDMSVNSLRHEQSMLRRAALRNVLVALLLAVVLSLIVTRALLGTVRVFMDAAQRVEGGDLDFQLAPFGPRETRGFVEAFNHMIRGLKQTSEDFPTGLFNNRYLHERLSSEIERAGRFGHNLCLLMIDLDRFKLMNDTFGHPVGDSILWQLGVVLGDSIRSIDVAARCGGDEFAVLLPETSEKAGLAAAERIRAKVESHSFYAVPLEDMLDESYVVDGRHIINLTVTIGLACYPEHHHTRDGLMMAADIALCRAKHIARNSVCAYDAKTGAEQHVDLDRLSQMLRDPNFTAAQSLVDIKDFHAGGHSDRVTRYVLEMAEALGMNPDTRDALKVAGLLHDVGKFGVPDSILNKPGSLTQEEQEAVMQHPSVGEKIVRRGPQLDLIMPAVLFHHERWDGAGYPDGLAGESIPLVARILAIADAFDAMTSDRPYRKAMSVEEALLELRANAGKQFDPALVEMFIGKMSSSAQGRAA